MLPFLGWAMTVRGCFQFTIFSLKLPNGPGCPFRKRRGQNLKCTPSFHLSQSSSLGYIDILTLTEEPGMRFFHIHWLASPLPCKINPSVGITVPPGYFLVSITFPLTIILSIPSCFGVFSPKKWS